MNHLPHVVDLFPDFVSRAFDPGLAQIDRICQERTAGMNAFGIAAFSQFDALSLKELAQILVKLMFFDRFHIRGLTVADGAAGGNYRAKV